MKNPFHGSYVALPTPFAEGRLDLEALRALIDAHAESATAGLVLCGTTGEAATLTEEERREVVRVGLVEAAGRLPVIVGVGTNVTRDSVARARQAQADGVAGILVVTPYYNRPSPRGLLNHFGAVAEAVDLPVVLYNVPSRTGVDLTPDLAARLAERHPNVVAIKEATTSEARIRALAEVEGLAVLAGEDGRLADFARSGAAGAIGVVSNVVPDRVAELLQAARPGGDGMRALSIERELAPLVRALFVESNPVPVKHALARLGWCREEVRAPLAPLEDPSRRLIEETLGRCSDLLRPSSPTART